MNEDIGQSHADPLQEPSRPPIRRGAVLWGLFLVAIGSAFLVQRFMGIDFPRIWHLWPLVFFVIGTNHLLDRRPGGAVTMYLFGLWFFSVNFDWFGMTYRNSWPLFLIAIGTGMVIRSLTGEDRWRKRGEWS